MTSSDFPGHMIPSRTDIHVGATAPIDTMRSASLLRRRHRRWRWLIITIVALLCLVVASAAAAATAPGMTGRLLSHLIPMQAGVVAWNGRDPVTILAMGVDQRTTEVTRSDTMIILHIDPAARKVTMLSVPRDIWVSIPESSPAKVNSGYAIGGPHFAELTVENFLGIPIDYYAVVRFPGFKQLVDALGGVTVNVKTEINDPTYPADVGNGFMPIDIKAGVQHMNGTTALEYVRSRHTDPLGDVGRNLRQQQVLVAIAKQFLSPSTVVQMPAILSALNAALLTDIPHNAMPELALLLTHARNSIVRQALTQQAGDLTQSWSYDGQWIWVPNMTAINQLTQSLFPNPAATTSISMAVENGTATSGLAATFSGVLANIGYHVGTVSDASGGPYQRSQVIINTSLSTADQAARQIGMMLHVAPQTQALGTSAPQITVIIGRDFPGAT